MSTRKPKRTAKKKRAPKRKQDSQRIEMQIETVEIDYLIDSAVNARTHSKEQVAQIAESITEFGFTNPVLIDPNNEIIAGHGRVMAARVLNLERVPCIRLSHLTDVQVRAYRLADNKIAANSGWDMEKLKAEIEELQRFDFDVQITGFDAAELKDILEGAGGNQYSRKITTPIYEPKGERPEIAALVDSRKTLTLIEEIEASDASDPEKAFLIQAAQRHLVFDYQAVAEFYCHASKEVQALMEKSALVIIDFDKAIENGYVELSKKMSDIYANSFGENAKGESEA